MTILLIFLLLILAGASCVAIAHAVAWPDSPRVLFRGWRCALRGWQDRGWLWLRSKIRRSIDDPERAATRTLLLLLQERERGHGRAIDRALRRERDLGDDTAIELRHLKDGVLPRVRGRMGLETERG